MSSGSSSVRPVSIYTMRAASKAPSSAGSYEGMVKFVIRRRMLRVIVLSAIFTWSCANFWAFSPRNGLFHEIIANFSPNTFILLSLTFGLGVLPSFVTLRLILRREYTAPSTAVYPTLAARLWALVSPALGPFIGVYALQGWVLAFTYCVSAGTREWDEPRLSVFAPSARHRFLLNERFVFLVLSNVTVGVLYALRARAISRSVDAWPSFTTRPPHRPNFLPGLQANTLPTLTLSGATSIGFTVAYYLFRLRVWRTTLYLLPFLRPYMGSFVRAKHSPVTFGMAFRSLTLNVLSAAIWEFVRVLLEVYATEPIVMSNFAADSNATLISGLVSSDLYVKHHAFHELAVLAQTSSPEASARRKALLSDLKTPHASYTPPSNGSVPYATSGAWAVLLREALLVLGRDYQTLLHRGNVPPPPATPAPAAPAPAAAAAPVTPQNKKSSVVVKPGGSSVFRPPPASPSATRAKIMDSFASDGASTSVLSGLVESAAATASAIPSIFLGEGPHAAATSSSSSATGVAVKKAPEVENGVLTGVMRLASAPGATVSEVRKAVGRAALDVEARSLRILPPAVRYRVYDARWWLFDSSLEKVESALRGRKIDLWIVESLAYLTAHSLEEDAYGVVQKDVPRVIEAVLSFTAALEAYAQELEKLTSAAHPVPPEGDDVDDEMRRYLETRRLKESEAIGEIVGPLLTGLRSGVKLIAGAFGERLEWFKFPPETAERLQAIVDQ